MANHSESYCYDPEEYVKLYYRGSYPNDLEEELLEWIKGKIHDIFAEGKYKGNRILDIGSGPVVYAVITASKYFDEVYVSDLVKANVELLQKWMRGESEHMQYLMEQYVAKDGNSETWQQKNMEVRNKIKGAFVCDMHKIDMLSGTLLDGLTVDVVTACLCMGASNPDGIESFRQSLKNFSKILNPGGHLMIVDLMESTWYAAHNMVFRRLSVTEEDLRFAFKDSGLRIAYLEIEKLSPLLEQTTCDAKTMYSLVATKL